MRNFLKIISLVCLAFNLNAQQLATKGFSLPISTSTTRPLKVMLAFVQRWKTPRDANGNPTGPSFIDGDSNWPANSLPNDADDYFEQIATNPSFQKYISKYFYESSFGQFIVTGDYLRDPIIVPDIITMQMITLMPKLRHVTLLQVVLTVQAQVFFNIILYYPHLITILHLGMMVY
jgi:hypothetical protein